MEENMYEKIFKYFSTSIEADDTFYKRSDVEYTYGDAGKIVQSLSNYFQSENIGIGDVIAIEAEKEFSVYCCIVACIINGITYVPFSKNQNFNRIRESLSIISTKLVITATEDALIYFKKNNENVTLISDIKPSSKAISQKNIPDDQVAYIMLSSGTTGIPKLIPITRKNLQSYIDSIESQFSINKKSGFSQIAELTFDLSVHDIFLCISNRGYLCPIKASEGVFAYRFVNDLGINYWMSVPSTVSFMFQMIPNIEPMPTLKYTFFLGEALSTDVVKKWLNLTKNGITVNTYGPTECTVAASFFVINPTDPMLDNEKLVPIGKALKNSTLYSDDKSNSELLLGGDQLFPGYIGKASKSNTSKFANIGSNRMYKTGDLVDKWGGLYFFKGRIDFQVKVRGYRIEIEELEAILNKHLVVDVCIVPVKEIQIFNYEGIAILYAGNIDDNQVKDAITKYFPNYVPIKKILKSEIIPRNINGKIDRNVAKEHLMS